MIISLILRCHLDYCASQTMSASSTVCKLQLRARFHLLGQWNLNERESRNWPSTHYQLQLIPGLLLRVKHVSRNPICGRSSGLEVRPKAQDSRSCSPPVSLGQISLTILVFQFVRYKNICLLDRIIVRSHKVVKIKILWRL